MECNKSKEWVRDFFTQFIDKEYVTRFLTWSASLLIDKYKKEFKVQPYFFCVYAFYADEVIF